MTDATPHPLVGATVAGYTLTAVRASMPTATDFDALRPPESDARSPNESGAHRAPESDARSPNDVDRAWIRVWHAPPPAPEPEPRRRWSVGGRRARSASSPLPDPTREQGDREGRDRAVLADHRLRSPLVPRPRAVARTAAHCEPPFAGCRAAVFPPLHLNGVAPSTTSECPTAAQAGRFLEPFLGLLVELSESGYRMEPVTLADVTWSASHLVLTRFDWSTTDGTSAAAGGSVRHLLSPLDTLVAELSGLLSDAPPRSLAASWADWTALIADGTPMRAAATLLEAQLRLWCAPQEGTTKAAPTEVDAACGRHARPPRGPPEGSR